MHFDNHQNLTLKNDSKKRCSHEGTTIFSHRLLRKGQGEGEGDHKERRGKQGKKIRGRRKEEEERRECQSPSGIRQEAGSEKKRVIVGQDVQHHQHPRRSREGKEPDVVC